jgi:alpha-L-rhamnosidase
LSGESDTNFTNFHEDSWKFVKFVSRFELLTIWINENAYFLMKKLIRPFLGIATLALTKLAAQDPYKEQRANWLQIAVQTEPKLVETIKRPLHIVNVEKSETAFQGWKITPKSSMDTLYQNSLKKQSVVMVDFGEHLTGFVTFKIEDFGRVADAPLRRLKK